MCVWSPTTGGVRVPRGAQDARAGAGGRARPRHGSQQGTFREHSGNIQGTFASGFLQVGAFREHSGNIQGTFS
eukprot:1181984-Prorocentrum_minimum.AAC.1